MDINVSSYGPLNQQSVKRISETLGKALQEYPRTLVVRVDLRLPDAQVYDSTLITRFLVSVKTQVKADLDRKKRANIRIHPCHVRYIWAREFGQHSKKHYHVVLLLNKDAYAYTGSYQSEHHNLAYMIQEAWGRALNTGRTPDYRSYYSLVEFPTNPYYHLNTRKDGFNCDYQIVMNRVLYLAKIFSKDCSDGQRNFGYSQY